jgi:outer membrane cobalamin receptor
MRATAGLLCLGPCLCLVLRIARSFCVKNFPRTSLALALSLAFPCALSLLATPARAQTAPTTTASADTAPTQRVEISAQRQKLDAARNGLSPDTGSSVYRFDAEDLQRLPEGESTPLNQVLLQAPGVVQDSYGQLHVRGDHANLQYRIDGIQIPESISGFGQALQTRLADHLSLITGALPAQYGNRTAGVVDIHTKDSTFANGGSVGLETGSNGHREASAEVGGTEGR